MRKRLIESYATKFWAAIVSTFFACVLLFAAYLAAVEGRVK
jgi:hypothetical protein